ncbi:MAG: hypothetical protein Q8O67_05440 [Deltaproteobacteria bacterium]|nr:hypothetical protein [Deltaproteobacteria bacterium]
MRAALPHTPAADAHEPRALGLRELRRRIAHHVVRVIVAAVVVTGAGAGVSVYLAEVGTRSCESDDEETFTGNTATHEVCVTRSWWPLTFQVRAETWSEDGVAHGPRLEWHANGAPWIQGSYERGLRVGPWTEFFDNGAPRFRGTYVDDVLQGDESWYYDDGSLEWTVRRAAGKREGVERWLWPNGQLRREGAYSRGEKHGRFNSYNDEGALFSTTNYVDGVPSSPSPLPD